MLETPRETRGHRCYSLLALVPRQVRLADNQKMKKTSKTLENAVVEATKTKKKSSKESPLLLSIAAYLQGKGFTKTLAKFRDEASIGEFDCSKIHALDLETYLNYLETRQCDAKNGLGDNGILNDGVTEDQEESKRAMLEELGTKKKKKNNVDVAGKADKQPGDGIEFIKCVNDSDDKSTKPHVKKKKNKFGSDSVDEKSRYISSETILGSTGKIVPEPGSDKLDKKSKDKKKKKSKPIVAENDESETCFEGKSTSENNGNILLDVKKSKSKDKKRTKISANLDDQNTKVFNQIDIGKNDSDASALDCAISVDKKGSKKRKNMDSEGKESHAEKDGKQTVDVSVEKEKANELLEIDGHASKKRKTKNGQVGHTNTVVHPDDDLEKNGREGSALPKSLKKQQNGSAEPKTVNAFRRVKIDEVEFADDRLQDNSYWAKHGADVGYGAKAQEVLGQVRGRDFRHEKTKKKRGSYRGGQIDLQTHSIKFNYSDEE